MRFTKNVATDFDVTTLVADMGVRYWEDGIVNGQEDNDDNPQMPLIKGGRWVLFIDLASGVIADWPHGTTASVHYKICDDGVYSLLDEAMNLIAKRGGYVPEMLAPSGEGYGDYAIMDIDASGKISGWEANLSYFDRGENE